jgi:hypothetical protein
VIQSLAAAIEDVDQIAHRTRQRLRQSEEHRKAWDLHTTFEIADERLIRFAAVGELLLGEAARGAKCAQVRPENFAF